jgi:RNA polymerase sigma-70 factor (ECF subfamily)
VAVTGEPVFPADRFRPDDDPEWPGHWASPPQEWADDRVDDEALAEVRAAILAMAPELRQVIVLRDVEGRSSEQVRAALGLSAADEITMLHQARGAVRERLEHYFEGRSA